MVTTSATIKRISREMLRKQYGKFVRPEGAIFAITGSINEERAKALAEHLLGAWTATAGSLEDLTPIADEPVKGVYFIKGPYTQASIMIAQRGVRRFSPDYASIDIFNEVFGASGFSSRLFKTVRTKQGLAYSVGGGIFAGRRSGQNMIVIQTKGESTGVAVAEALNVLRGIKEEGVTSDELTDSRRAIVNGFVFQVDSTSDVLTRGITQRYAGYPENFDAKYLADIAEVRAGDVRTVANQRWNLDNLLVVVAGDQTAYNSLTQALAGIPELNIPVQELEFDEAAKLK
jgi:zinc protease